MKKRFAFLLGLIIALTVISAAAEDPASAGEIMLSGPLTESVTASASEQGLTNDEAAEGYIRKMLQPEDSGNSRSVPRSNAVGTQLTGAARKLYDAMRPLIVQAAAGKISSTEFDIPLSLLAEDKTYTLTDLGFDSADDRQSVYDEFAARTGVPTWDDMNRVVYVLMVDMPYELYWFDKTAGWSTGYRGCSCSVDGYGNVFFSNYKNSSVHIGMRVAKAYSQANETGTFQLKTTLGQAVQEAAANVKTILADNRTKSDYAKMKAYRDWIRDHCEYNHPAADDDSTPYGDPWQLVWVFDGDPDTKVVCEGFSKAFKYLCDLTAFKGSVSVICVSGMMQSSSGGGRHMWNVVALNNGKRYMADVTNDSTYNPVFLVGYSDSQTQSDGSVAYKYGNCWYIYNSSTTNMFQPEELAVVSGGAYTGGDDPAESAWEEPVYTWAEDHSSVTALLASKTDPYATVLETVPAVLTGKTDADCTNPELSTYASEPGAFINPYFSDQTITVETAPALGHDWQLPEYFWNEDYSQVTACRTCIRDMAHSETETVGSTSAVTKEPTCLEWGYTTYTSASFVNSVFEVQIQPVENLLPLGHDWGDPIYVWGEDNQTVTAYRFCNRDPEHHEEDETVKATGTVAKEPTCTVKGDTTYTSAAFENAAFTVQTKTETDIDPLGHDWDTPVYIWNDDYTAVTATRICKHDGDHKETETAAVTSKQTKAATCTKNGETTYTSNAFKNGAFEVQSRKLDNIPATGHKWSDVTYSWSADKSQVTAKRVCANDSSEVETETMAATAKRTKEPTCTAAGEMTYTGKAFTNTAFTAQIKKETIPALGHKWGPVSYTWSDDESEVTALSVCENDASHESTETAKLEESIESPTETKDGAIVHTYRFNKSIFTDQVKKTAIPALGKMNTLRLPESLEIIEEEAFANLPCQAVVIPDGCTAIGSRAFMNCAEMVYIQIPASVTDIAEDAFAGCSEDLIIDRPGE